MPKNTVIRSDKKHAVNMPEGTNVAERKTTRKYSEPDSPAETPPNIQKVPAAKATASKRKAAPAPAAKTVRAKATLTRNAPAPAAPAPAPTPAKPRSASRTKPASPKPAQPVWGPDSQVRKRIDQLKTRNAQLAEQLQRLSALPTARGTRP